MYTVDKGNSSKILLTEVSVKLSRKLKTVKIS